MLAGIALGSNIGDRLGSLRQASQMIKCMGTAIIAASDVFETPPWGVRDQPWFLNALSLIHI